MSLPRNDYRKRARYACMSHKDNVWFTEVLREAISPLQLLLIDEFNKRIELVDTLAGHDQFVMITSPEGRGATLKQLQTALRRSLHSLDEPFRSLLPSRAALYMPDEALHRVTARYDETGRPVEIFSESRFHFVYLSDDKVAHAFANRFMRIMDKHLIHQFVVVNSETREIVEEVPSGGHIWVGPDVAESCRRTPDRYIGPVYSGTGVMHCLAPVPDVEQTQIKARRRKPSRV
jgi:hypothetical protein